MKEYNASVHVNTKPGIVLDDRNFSLMSEKNLFQLPVDYLHGQNNDAKELQGFSYGMKDLVIITKLIFEIGKVCS